MSVFQLSKRLEMASSYVLTGARLADIGSDHAYLPCHLAKQGRVEFAIAGEVAIGPFSAAVKQIKTFQVEERVVARLGDGLAVIEKEDQIDTVTICGMGGDLITRILDTGQAASKLETIQRLILQANNAEPNLRLWLMKNGYQIINEEIFEENEKIYELIVASPSETEVTYDDADLIFGNHLRQEKNDIFMKKWRKELKTYYFILDSLKHSQQNITEKKKDVERMIAIIEEEIL